MTEMRSILNSTDESWVNFGLFKSVSIIGYFFGYFKNQFGKFSFIIKIMDIFSYFSIILKSLVDLLRFKAQALNHLTKTFISLRTETHLQITQT